MPRKPDPDLEDRILKAAQLLWKRGGEKALTLRAVAKAAGTNTPAVYRRFKDRKEIVIALLRYYQADLAKQFRDTDSIEEIAEVFVDYLVKRPHAYELLLAHGRELIPPARPGRKPAAIRESRPNFASLEERLARRLGGSPEDHTKLALALWSLAQGAAAILLSRAIPEGHEEELRSACRAGVKKLFVEAARSWGKK
jgi:AcrR family transcriptional regulator